MKKIALFLVLFLVLTVLLIPATPTSAQSSIQVGCVDFLAFPDNTVLGVNFTLNGFQFRSRPGLVPFVNVFADALGNPVHGVQFPDAGLGVKLDAPTNVVNIRIGVFNNPPVSIRGYDATRTPVAGAGVPADNIMHNVNLVSGGNPIVFVGFVGGGNEAVINQICTN